MVTDRMRQMLNDQIQREVYSSYLYLSMSTYFEDINMSGFAHWMRVQTQEEWGHAMKIINYMNLRDLRVLLQAVPEPKNQWDSVLACMEDAYAHEQLVSEHINDIANVAREEHDNATLSFIYWFVNEQVEEEAQVKGIIDQLKLVANSPNGIYLIDRSLASRA